MSESLDTVFSSVLLASRDATILALAIGLILIVLGRKIPPAWRHGLWMLVVIRLLLPSLPGGALSWQRLLPSPAPAIVASVPAEPQPPERKLPTPLSEPELELAPAAPIRDASIKMDSDKTLFTPAAIPLQIDWKRALLFAWLVGALGYLLLIFTLDFRFRRRVRILTEHDARGVENARDLLDRVAREQRCRPPTLRITRAVSVPAVAGLLRTEILLPPATLERLDETELRLVLLHELAHLRRRDLWLNWLLALLQAVHWFNPVLWWAFHRLRVEAESAADAWVLHRCGVETPSRYGETLLRLLEGESPRRRIAVPGVVGVVESPRDLRSRIQMIARFSRKRNRLAALGTAALIVALAAVGLTQAPEEETEKSSPQAAKEDFPLPEAIDSPTTRVSDVEITVLDEAGAPVEGAEVFVTPGNDYLAQVLTPISLRGRTDANGKLHGRTEPVREDTRFGLFYVMAFKVGFAGFSWLQPESDPTTGKVDFESGTIQGMVKLTPAEIMRTKIVRPDGSPVVGLRVWVDGIGLPRASDETFSFFGNPPPLSDGYWEAVTDERGVLEMRDIPRGAGIHLSHDQEEWAAFPGYHHILVDGLTAADETRTITLAPAASVSGRVRSPSGRGVPNIIVEALEHTPYVNAHHGYAISDADGIYRLKALPEGNYKLFATGRGGHGQNFWVLDGGGDLKLKVGETITNQNFEFKRGGRLVRRLIDEASGDLITESSATVGLPGTIKGVYHSGRTPAGYHENRQMYESEIRAGEITYLDIPFRKRAPSDQISGVVVDATGNPVSGAKVKCPSIQAPMSNRITETDESGRFAFDLPPDTKEVSLIAWEGDRISDTVTRYTSGTEVTIQLLENQFGTVVGRVIDGNGNPLFKARFYSTGQELPGVTERSIETDLDGLFRIAVLPEKLVTFWISRDGHTKVARQGKIEAGVETDLGDIQLETATASVAGRVIYTDGQPASQARLRISGQNQPHLENLVTDTEGQFQIQGVAEGWLWVEAYSQFDDGGQSGKSRIRSGSTNVRVVLGPTPDWKPENPIDFVGKPAPPLNVDHRYNAPTPNPEHKGKIRMIRFVGKDRPLIYFSGTVKLIQELQAEFAGKDVEFLIVHGPWPKEEVDEILAADHPNLTVPLAIESEKDAMSDAFGVRTWLTVVIDREGKVVFQHHSGKGSKAAVQKLLDAEEAGTPKEIDVPAAAEETSPDKAAASETETLLGVCQVRDKDGHPVPDAEIFFLAHGWSGKTVVEIRRTDAKGEAEFVLDRASLVRTGQAIQFEFFAKKQEVGLGGSGSFDFWQMDKKVHELTLEMGTEVAVKLVDPTGRCLTGVRVFASSWLHPDPVKLVRPGGFSDDFWTGVTGQNGIAIIRNLPTGVEVGWDHEAEGFAKLNSSPGYGPRGNTTRVGVETEVTLELEPGALVSGHVMAADGKAVPDARITLVERNNKDGFVYQASSDGEGVFRVEGVNAGAYELHTLLFGTGIDTDKWSAAPIHLQQVDAGSSLDGIEVRLKKAARVRGRITLDGSDEGVAGITVESAHSTATNPIGGILSRTNEDGYYDLPVPPGDSVLWVKNGAGATIRSLPFDVGEGETATRDFQISKADSIGQRIEISGTILDKDGEPVSGGVILSTLNLNWLTSQQVSSDATGEFVLPASPLANRVSLFAWKGNQATSTTLAPPFDKGGIVLQLKEVERPKLSGRVMGSTGEPIAGAEVRWGAGLIDALEQTTLTDAEGWFRFSMLPPFESIPLLARKDGFGRTETVVSFSDSREITTENLILQRADLRVSGIVLDATGKPVHDVWVAVIGATQPVVEVFTNELGEFELAGIVDAPLKIHAVGRTPSGNIDRVEDATAGDTGIVVGLPPAP